MEQSLKERPIIFSGESVRAILTNRKSMTRRAVARSNSLVDGSGCSKAFWDSLRLEEAWIDPGPSPAGNPGPYLKVPRGTGAHQTVHRVYSRWQIGDRLWLKETWNHGTCTNPRARGIASFPPKTMPKNVDHFSIEELDRLICRMHPDSPPEERDWCMTWKKKSPIFMFRWASRIMLELTDVSVERVQEISEEDIEAEGVEPLKIVTKVDRVISMDVIQPGIMGGSFVGEVELDHRKPFAELWDSINGKRPGCSWDDNPWCWCLGFKVV